MLDSTVEENNTYHTSAVRRLRRKNHHKSLLKRLERRSFFPNMYRCCSCWNEGYFTNTSHVSCGWDEIYFTNTNHVYCGWNGNKRPTRITFKSGWNVEKIYRLELRVLRSQNHTNTNHFFKKNGWNIELVAVDNTKLRRNCVSNKEIPD